MDHVGVAKKHTESVHKGIRPTPYKCPHCDYHCASSYIVQRHIRVKHTKEKPFQCEYCSSSFARKGQLDNHVVVHTGEQRFHCKLCPKKFATNDRLKVHMRTHTGEKPFQCHLCSAMFLAKSNMNAHVRGVHKESLYKLNFTTGWKKATDPILGHETCTKVGYELPFENHPRMILFSRFCTEINGILYQHLTR